MSDIFFYINKLNKFKLDYVLDRAKSEKEKHNFDIEEFKNFISIKNAKDYGYTSRHPFFDILSDFKKEKGFKSEKKKEIIYLIKFFVFIFRFYWINLFSKSDIAIISREMDLKLLDYDFKNFEILFFPSLPSKIPYRLLKIQTKTRKIFKKGNRNLCIFTVGGDILSNGYLYLFTVINFNKNFSLKGVQHGGGYRELNSLFFKNEILCFEEFVHQKYYCIEGLYKNNSKNINLFGFTKKPGFIYAKGGDPSYLYALNKKIWNDEIKKDQDLIENFLLKSSFNMWIKQHPKFKNGKDFRNEEIFGENSYKPYPDINKILAIIVDSPGTTIALISEQLGIPVIYIYDPKYFPITNYEYSRVENFKQEKRFLIPQNITEINAILKNFRE